MLFPAVIVNITVDAKSVAAVACCFRNDIPRMFGVEGLQPLKIHLDEGKSGPFTLFIPTEGAQASLLLVLCVCLNH